MLRSMTATHYPATEYALVVVSSDLAARYYGGNCGAIQSWVTQLLPGPVDSAPPDPGRFHIDWIRSLYLILGTVYTHELHNHK